MATIKKTIEVDVPVRTAYDRWTRFESFPEFMEGIKEVRQLDDKSLFWHAEIAGKDVEWEADITEQVPDVRIAWKSRTGKPNAGVVDFHRLEDNKTQVALQMDYETEGITETVGDALGFTGHRVEADLERFKNLVEKSGSPAGGWRGTVEPPRG